MEKLRRRSITFSDAALALNSGLSALANRNGSARPMASRTFSMAPCRYWTKTSTTRMSRGSRPTLRRTARSVASYMRVEHCSTSLHPQFNRLTLDAPARNTQARYNICPTTNIDVVIEHLNALMRGWSRYGTRWVSSR
jgi:hypothetical protein